MVTMIRVPFRKQKLNYTCGPVSVHMVLAHFGFRVEQADLIVEMKASPKTGTTHKNMVKALRKRGLHVFESSHWTIDELKRRVALGHPVIVNYQEPDEDASHYSVVIGYSNSRVILHDPWNGREFTLSDQEFCDRWYNYSTQPDIKWAISVRA
jgi:predicted double-glycine peptidase